LASLAGKDAVYAVGFGNKATVTSYGIRNPCVRQKVSGSEVLGKSGSAVALIHLDGAADV
jgi:hypothetical protein